MHTLINVLLITHAALEQYPTELSKKKTQGCSFTYLSHSCKINLLRRTEVFV